MAKSIGGHQSAIPITNEYITPDWVVKGLGTFELDPCSPIIKPRPTALQHYTIEDNGLILPWENKRVWLNPPYSRREVTPWLAMMAKHKNGILLIFNRSDRADHHTYVLPVASSQFLLNGRITFENNLGIPYGANGGAPNVFYAYGEENDDALADCGFRGKHIPLNTAPNIVIKISPSWKWVVDIALTRLSGKGSVQQVYEVVENIADDKVKRNKNWREKVRQKLQTHFTKTERGFYTNTSA